MDAGKSTLLGVLTHGELDNGRGTARQKLFRHKHEMESGRTSSVGNDILGFNQEGRVVNKTDGHGENTCNHSYGHSPYVKDLYTHTRILSFHVVLLLYVVYVVYMYTYKMLLFSYSQE